MLIRQQFCSIFMHQLCQALSHNYLAKSRIFNATVLLDGTLKLKLD